MLEMKRACERCKAVLRHDADAFICSYECTYCGPCTFGELEQTCPSCGGELSRRPKREADADKDAPAEKDKPKGKKTKSFGKKQETLL